MSNFESVPIDGIRKHDILMLPKNTASQLDILISSAIISGDDAIGMVYESLKSQTSTNINVYKTVDRSNFFNVLTWRVAVLKGIYQSKVIHYHFCKAPKMKGLDLTWCKLLDKPRFIQFWGSDVRRKSVWQDLLPTWELLPESYRIKISDDVSLRRQEEFAEKGFEAISSSWMLGQCIDKNLFRKVHHSRASVELSRFRAAPPCPKKIKPLMLHFPSNPELKGTEYVMRAIEILEKTRKFDFRVITNMRRADLLKLVEEADVIVDQFLLGAYGLAAIESMAMAKPVVCYVAPEYRKNLPSSCPIVNSHPDDLVGVLDGLICDAQLRHDIGVRGRSYVEEYHCSGQVTGELKEIYKTWNK
ncbi:glycosyltransferase [Akkermansiaceae bacterium]|nr:glycosyltransferase [Akkermansiaceae bacterium]